MVGESGCGKSVTALSVMRLVPHAAGALSSQAACGIRYRGTDLLQACPQREMRKIRGNRMAR